MDSNAPLLAWDTLEFEPRNHPADWYWIVGIITTALVIICIILGNFFLGIIIALGVSLLAFFTTQEPQYVRVAIDEKGVLVGDKFHSYKSIDSFALIEKDFIPKLVFKSKRFHLPFIIVKIHGYDPEIVQEVLQEFIKEDDHVEPLLYKLMDYLGF
jgi:hypothetical protein